LFKELGNLQHRVSTPSEQAQAYFNQGLRLIYGFNHHEALRSFKEAARLDPNCAMAYWGQALALAPNINLPIDQERSQQGYAAIQHAVSLLKKKAPAPERAYIEAMAKRFSKDENADRPRLDSAYAVAMAKLAEKYPNDPDAGTLYADALMNRRPWDYWTKDRKPRPGIEKAISTIESIIRRFPDHPGAHHLYIHLVEASNDPDRGISSADQLASLMPGAGHLVHMPAHIYLRVGRYADATQSNLKAVEVDEAYITQCQAQGVYTMGYYPHNIHFIWAAATMEGKSQLAIEMARKTASKVDRQLMSSVAPLEGFYILPLQAYVRFGKWNEILTEPYPGKELAHANTFWHYARGIAYTAKGQLDRAGKELSILDSLSKDTTLVTTYASQNPTSSILAIAIKTLMGEMASKQKNYPKAIRLFKEAVNLEDDLRYDEPRSWPQPVRHSLGAILLEANRPKEAEAVYREDLKIHRENGWSLYGLQQSLLAQGKNDEAASVEKRFKVAWAAADLRLQSSRF
jgi:tetratricopeptide (TPR) repeat protein